MIQQHNSTADATSAQTSTPATVTTEEEERVSRATDQLQWQRPRHGWWKCNVDASLSQYSSH
ncbi:hypothetical protein A2U01_0070866, partial [Trifolium medium]|nr:hypothetical protein [Trifolium medium]